MPSRHAPAVAIRPRVSSLPDVVLIPAGVLCFVALTALFAQIRIPLPGGVPITLQTLAVSLAALTLGPRIGALAMGVYLAFGLVGVPVFSGRGSGPEVVFGATGGYLLAFVLAQPIINLLARSDPLPLWRGAIAIAAGHLAIFSIGVPWYAMTTGADLPGAIANGFLVFLPGLVLKSLLAALPAPWLVRLPRARGW